MSLHWLVSIVPGISWVVSQLKKRKVFIEPAGASSNLPLSLLLSPSSNVFLSVARLIDTPLLQRHGVMSLSTLCGFLKPLAVCLLFFLVFLLSLV